MQTSKCMTRVPYCFSCMLVETAVQADAEEALHFLETVDREKEIFQNSIFATWTTCSQILSTTVQKPWKLAKLAKIL